MRPVLPSCYTSSPHLPPPLTHSHSHTALLLTHIRTYAHWQKKTYLEGTDQEETQSDMSYAEDEWTRYLARNQSAVVDMMTGQYVLF